MIRTFRADRSCTIAGCARRARVRRARRVRGRGRDRRLQEPRPTCSSERAHLHRRSCATVDDALAIRGDRVVALGADARRMPSGRRIDAGGKLVIPGIDDAHVHPPVLFAPYDDRRSTKPQLDDSLASLRARREHQPAGTWIHAVLGVDALDDPGLTRDALDRRADPPAVDRQRLYGARRRPEQCRRTLARTAFESLQRVASSTSRAGIGVRALRAMRKRAPRWRPMPSSPPRSPRSRTRQPGLASPPCRRSPSTSTPNASCA